MSSARIGVIVPAYNAGRWILATLASLSAQTDESWLCVIVDDGSTDDTAELARSAIAADPRFHLLSQPNAGIAGARNTGLNALPPTCEFVCFVDSDDVLVASAFQTLLDALGPRPDAAGAYGLAEYIDGAGSVVLPGAHPSRQRDRREVVGHRLVDTPANADAKFAVMIVTGPIWPAAVALHRLPFVRAIGGFDTSYTTQEDWDLYIRLSRLGPYVAIDQIVAYYRRHGSNVTGNHYQNEYELQRVRENAHKSPANTAQQKKQVRRAWRYLESRQELNLIRDLIACVRCRDWSGVAHALAGIGLTAFNLVRLAPATPRRGWLPYTRPAATDRQAD